MEGHNIYISNLRVAATIGVILIHATTGYLQQVPVGSFNWDYANWMNGLTRYAVPIFVMISGALLLHKEESTLDFYRKRLLKIVPPFLFWTLVYIIYYFWKSGTWANLSMQQITSISWTKFRTGANAHLWYLYMIMGLYLAIPFLRKMVKHCSTRELELFLLIWFVSLFIVNKRWQDIVIRIDLTFFTNYIGYLVLGYYLSIQDFSKSRIWFVILWLASCAFTIYITHTLSVSQQKYDPSFYGYVLPNIAVAATAFFVCIKYFSKRVTSPLWISLIDKYSFGIYLAHIIVLNYVHPQLPDAIWLKVPLATIATLAGSMLLVYIIQKVPYGKYVSG